LEVLGSAPYDAGIVWKHNIK